MMHTIYGDFNAMTEAGHMRLTTRGAQADIARFGIEPGDWVWLTDTELVVGAAVSTDSRYGIVGVMDWDTLVHLDDADAGDGDHIRAELDPLLAKDAPSRDDKWRIFQRLTQLDFASPPTRFVSSLGSLPLLRARLLEELGKRELALVEMNEARKTEVTMQR